MRSDISVVYDTVHGIFVLDLVRSSSWGLLIVLTFSSLWLAPQPGSGQVWLNNMNLRFRLIESLTCGRRRVVKVRDIRLDQ